MKAKKSANSNGLSNVAKLLETEPCNQFNQFTPQSS